MSQERLYTKNHEWVLIEDGIATIGITDFAQTHLGDIVFVDLPEVGDEFEMEECFSTIDSVKATSDIYTPVSGEIVEANDALADHPELINADAYENWIVKIKLSENLDEDLVLDEAAYTAFCEEEE